MAARYTSWVGQLGIELAGLFFSMLLQHPPYNDGQLGSYRYIWCKATRYNAAGREDGIQQRQYFQLCSLSVRESEKKSKIWNKAD